MSGAPAEVINYKLHVGGIAIEQWNKVFGFDFHCRKPNTFIVEKLLIRDATTGSEKVFHAHVTVMKDPRVIDKADWIAVGKTNNDISGERHHT